MKGHAISRPESDERAQVIAELGDSPDKASTEHSGSTLGDVQIGCDVDAAVPKTAGEGSLAEQTLIPGHSKERKHDLKSAWVILT